MSELKQLAALVKELEDQTIVCMRCGLCQSVCPVFAETGRESDVARGKLALLDGVAREMLRKPEEAGQRLNKCLLCGSCAANCPSGVNVLEIFMKARAILTAYQGLPAAKRLILEKMLAHPRVFDRILEWGARFQNLVSRPVSETLGTSCARVASPLIGNRHFVPLAPQPFHKQLASLDTETGASGLKAAFFPGCLLDKFFPHVARDVVDVLTRHGVGIWMPPGQGCCGIPAVSAGDTATFEKLAMHNIELLEEKETDYLVTACATCTATLKEVWPAMLGNLPVEYQNRAKALAAKTVDIHQLLVDHVGITALPNGSDAAATVTYHDPCHLKKSLGVYQQPRDVVAASQGYQLVEMTGSDKCCGMGGSFNLQYYEISCSIGTLKKESIQATGADVVTTGCPACMLQISDMLSQANLDIAVKHPVELYAETIKHNGRTP